MLTKTAGALERATLIAKNGFSLVYLEIEKQLYLLKRVKDGLVELVPRTTKKNEIQSNQPHVNLSK